MAQPVYSRQQLQRAAVADERKYGLGDWFQAQIGQESGWNPNAHSSAGADGIAQFIPSTAKSYGLNNTRDPIASLDAAARYDRDLLHQYGSTERALSAYNSGRPDAYKDPGFAGGQTYNYVRSILGHVGGHQQVSAEPPAPIHPGLGGDAVPVAHGDLVAAAGKVQDFGPQLRSQLLQAAGTPTNDLSGFYGVLRQALQARQASQHPGTVTPSVTPQGGLVPRPGQQPPTHTLPMAHGQVLGNTVGENPGFLASLGELAAYEHAPVQINSGYRSTAKQAQLYANRASNPNPVAPPGHSLHERGLAADGTVAGKPLGTLPPALLARYGLQPVPGDPVHVQALR